MQAEENSALGLGGRVAAQVIARAYALGEERAGRGGVNGRVAVLALCLDSNAAGIGLGLEFIS